MAGAKAGNGAKVRKSVEITNLNWKKVRAADTHPAGGGLWLRVRGSKSRSWTLRYMVAGKAHWMALGSPDSIPPVTLADVIERAADMRGPICWRSAGR